ncbi:hypothetical protein BaRGS_00010685, partial [Batillaria attramentaria]
ARVQRHSLCLPSKNAATAHAHNTLARADEADNNYNGVNARSTVLSNCVTRITHRAVSCARHTTTMSTTTDKARHGAADVDRPRVTGFSSHTHKHTRTIAHRHPLDPSHSDI